MANYLTDSMLYVIFFSFTAIVPILFLWRSAAARNLFILVWLPSVIGGYITALTSTNGAPSMAIGIFPAMQAAVALLLMLLLQTDDSTLQPKPFCLTDAVSHFAVPLAIVAFIVTSTCSTIYRDAPQSDLTYRVEHGPFAGLYTTPERGSLIRLGKVRWAPK